MERCSSPRNPANRAIHVQGGPFLSWGGGVGIAMKDFDGNPAPTTDLLARAVMDVSAWEGISFLGPARP